ncbi:MAG: undecaprenyl-diphosphate phosphatase [Pseudomonadota bacterium]
MPALYIAVILGIIEGLTEFLPVSSTGHLIIAGELLAFTGEKAATFEVAIQLGAILAVVVLYWPRFWALVWPLPTMTDFATVVSFRSKNPSRKPKSLEEQEATSANKRVHTMPPFSGVRGLYMLFLTCLPASVLGLLLHSYIKEYLFTADTVVLSLAVGAFFILFVEAREKRRLSTLGSSKAEHVFRYHTLDDMTPRLALGIGLFQCLALWPGFSRSAATIMGGMILGAKRNVAAEYSFIAAVPIMFAATGYDLLKSWHLFSAADLPFFATGCLVSFLSAWAAVKLFIRLVGKMTFKPFAWYRLALAPIVYYFMVH